MESIKPCPICGKKPDTSYSESQKLWTTYHACDFSGVAIGYGKTAEESVRDWNRTAIEILLSLGVEDD